MKKWMNLKTILGVGILVISPLSLAKKMDQAICSQPQTAAIFKTFYETQHNTFDQRLLWDAYMVSPLDAHQRAKTNIAIYQTIWQQIKDDPTISEQEKQRFQAMTVEPEIKPEEIEAYNVLVKAKKLYFGEHVRQDQKEALNLLLVADEKGEGNAYELYSIIAKHCPDEQMQKNAVFALEEMAEILNEYEDYLSPIWAYLVHAYAYGVGVEVNEKKALQYWQKARYIYSLQFDTGGFVGFLMGQMVEQKPYLNAHLGDAMNYYKIATRADDHHIAAQNAILKLLKSTKKFDDLTYEIELFEATENAKYDSDPKSEYFTLSELYAQKQWDIYNPKQSIEWLNKAAEAGHERAQLNLALAYDEGNLVSPDGQKALQIYQQYFEKGNLLSGIFLLNRLEKGSQSIQANAFQAKKVREKLSAMYKEAGHSGEIPQPEELRLLQRLY